MRENDGVLQRVAEGHAGLVTADDVSGAGLTGDQLHWRLKMGTLRRVQPGVFAIVGSAGSFEQRVAAACLAGGPEAAVSHGTAARLWGLRGATTDAVHLTVPHGRHPRLADVVVHRSKVFSSADRRRRDGIVVTHPERTLVDCAAAEETAVLTGLLESALHLRLTTVARCWSYLSRYSGPGCRGAGRLGRVLARREPNARPTESGLEDLAVRVFRKHGLPQPVRQWRLEGSEGGGYRIDFAYPDLRLAIEIDSVAWHSDSRSYRRDRAKWNRLTQLGWAALIVTEFDLRHEPQRVVDDLRDMVRQRSAPVFDAKTASDTEIAPKTVRTGWGGGAGD